MVRYPGVYEHIQDIFPEFNYAQPAPDLDRARLKITHPNNVVGHQQRAVTIYWAYKQCNALDLGLDFGSHRGLTPFCAHVDRWYDNRKDHPVYGGVHPADVVADCAEPEKVFSRNCYPYIASNHSLEHMPAPGDDGVVDLLARWVDLLRSGGVLAMVVPDNDHFDVMASDRDHKHAWGHKDFRPRVLDKLLTRGAVELVEFDSLDNAYSFQVVLRKR